MTGNNTLILNAATIIEALQEYFDKRYTPNIKVLDCRPSSNASYGTQFQVEVGEIEGGEK